MIAAHFAPTFGARASRWRPIAALTARRSVARSFAARSSAESKYWTCGKTYGSASRSQCETAARSFSAFGFGVSGVRSGDGAPAQ